MTANERRKMLLERLCVCRHETRKNFAAEFGVSLRTIERDVVRLMSEYPVITIQGYGGGIGVEDWYKPDMKYLTDKQVELLEELLPTLTESKAAVMQSILDTFNPRKKKDKNI